MQYSADVLGGHGNGNPIINKKNVLISSWNYICICPQFLGGEYAVQIGFGWSNAVIIDYLAKYGETLKSFD